MSGLDTVKHVLFDLDGTLTDPYEGIITCLREALARMDVPLDPDRNLAWCIGPPLRESVAVLLGDADVSRVEQTIHFYRERFSTVGLFENRVYDGVPELLAGLCGRGVRMQVVTSKPTIYARRILERFDLSRYFEGIHGCELDGTLGDKRELLRHVLVNERLDPDACVMVGDREHDVRAARVNAVRSIGVTYGYGSAEELCSAGADLLAGSPAALSRILRQ